MINKKVSVTEARNISTNLYAIKDALGSKIPADCLDPMSLGDKVLSPDEISSIISDIESKRNLCESNKYVDSVMLSRVTYNSICLVVSAVSFIVLLLAGIISLFIN